MTEFSEIWDRISIAIAVPILEWTAPILNKDLN
jgi:hypothetical protein